MTQIARRGGRACAVAPNDRLAIRACPSTLLCPDHFCASASLGGSRTTCVTLLAKNIALDKCATLDKSTQTKWISALLSVLPPLARAQIHASNSTVACYNSDGLTGLGVNFPVGTAANISKQLQATGPFILPDGVSFRVFERSLSPPHPLVGCLDATPTTSTTTATTSTTSEGSGCVEFGAAVPTSAAKEHEGYHHIFSPTMIAVITVCIAVILLITVAIVFVFTTQRRLRDSLHLDVMNFTLGGDNAHSTQTATYGRTLDTPGGQSPFHTPKGSFAPKGSFVIKSPRSQRRTSASVPSPMPEVMQTMPNDIDSEDERLITPAPAQPPRKVRSRKRSSSPSDNPSDTLLEIGSGDSPPTQRVSDRLMFQTPAAAPPRTSPDLTQYSSDSSPRSTYRISVLDDDLEGFDDSDEFDIDGDSANFVDDVLDGLIDSQSHAFAPSASATYQSSSSGSSTPYLHRVTDLDDLM